MQTISAYILAFNAAEKLKAAAASVLWAHEIAVAGFHSTDNTAEITATIGARVVQVPFSGFGDLLNRAIETCRYHWIFSEIFGLLAGTPAAGWAGFVIALGNFEDYRYAKRYEQSENWAPPPLRRETKS